MAYILLFFVLNIILMLFNVLHSENPLSGLLMAKPNDAETHYRGYIDVRENRKRRKPSFAAPHHTNVNRP